MIRSFERTLSTRIGQGLPFIQVILGPRQVGKTTGAKRVFESWGDDKLFISADGPVPPDHYWIQEHWQKIRNAKSKRKLFVIDEIQKVSQWSATIKELYDEDRHSGLQLVLLGSSSLALESKLSESLLGRYEIIRAYHWSYAESRQLFQWSLDDYLKFGGYPAAAALVPDKERWQNFMQDSVIEPIISRDITLLREIAKPALFRQTLAIAMQYPAREISYQKLLGQLQEKGNAATIKTYLEYLKHAFLLELLEKFSTRPISVKTSSPKVIPLAPALIHAYTSPDRITTDKDWRGTVFEAVIGAKLKQHFANTLFYWREGKDEVDYVVEHDGTILGIEVKSGQQRKSPGINRFREYFPQAKLSLITEQLGCELLQQETTADVMECLKRSFIL